MRYLLFPDEERALIRYLCGQVGLQFLTSDSGAARNSDPVSLIATDFPTLRANEEREYYFWCCDIGPVRRLGDVPEPRDAVDAACLRMNQEARPESWRDLIDLARTPVISWRRPLWYGSDRKCLVPGRLGAMAAKVREHPSDLRRLYGRVDRWLRRPATKLNPFEHCSGLPVAEPKNLSTFWVAAWPQGKEWVHRGGELWPWDG